MQFPILTEENYIMAAMQNYQNPSCIDINEFYSDLSRIKYLKRLFKRYKNNQDLDSLKVRLCLNHLIVLHNVFPIPFLVRLLFLKIEKEFWTILVTFLNFLNYLPEIIPGVNSENIKTSGIQMDPDLSMCLEAL